ncbi:unnamed protein product [Prunus armeniaca]|uniref:Uncharacterized protein n=1 Tax=Prunus armeniaca TaxID=36596 RepID=A0A6J5X0R5_PRUAR|nr:unnamed protein product [Prunus armeniaca]
MQRHWKAVHVPLSTASHACLSCCRLNISAVLEIFEDPLGLSEANFIKLLSLRAGKFVNFVRKYDGKSLSLIVVGLRG